MQVSQGGVVLARRSFSQCHSLVSFACYLTGSSAGLLLLYHFSATGFLNVRDVPSLQDVMPDVKQLDFSGFLNC